MYAEPATSKRQAPCAVIIYKVRARFNRVAYRAEVCGTQGRFLQHVLTLHADNFPYRNTIEYFTDDSRNEFYGSDGRKVRAQALAWARKTAKESF
jgi:hypothetical protein